MVVKTPQCPFRPLLPPLQRPNALFLLLFPPTERKMVDPIFLFPCPVTCLYSHRHSLYHIIVIIIRLLIIRTIMIRTIHIINNAWIIIFSKDIEIRLPTAEEQSKNNQRILLNSMWEADGECDYVPL